MLQTLNDDKWYSGKASQADKAAIDSIKEQLKKYYSNIEDIINKQHSKYVLVSDYTSEYISFSCSE